MVVADLKLRARTNAQGQFQLDEVNAGRFSVTVRKLGYDSISVEVPFSGDDTVVRIFELTMRAQPLAGIPVRGKEVPILSAKLMQFERRRQLGTGRFLDSADLENQKNRRLGEILRPLPGVAIADGAGLSAFAFSSRGVNTIENQPAFSAPAGGRLRGATSCPVAVYLDGVALYRGATKMRVTPCLSALGPLICASAS